MVWAFSSRGGCVIGPLRGAVAILNDSARRGLESMWGDLRVLEQGERGRPEGTCHSWETCASSLVHQVTIYHAEIDIFFVADITWLLESAILYEPKVLGVGFVDTLKIHCKSSILIPFYVFTHSDAANDIPLEYRLCNFCNENMLEDEKHFFFVISCMGKIEMWFWLK